MTDEERIRDMVRRVVYRTVGRPPRPPVGRGPTLITERDLDEAPAGDHFVIPLGALVTPLARQAALARRITLVEAGSAASPGHRTGSEKNQRTAADRTVAIGSDHGGFELKEILRGHLGGLGYAVLDCGTDSTEATDYPDFALAVASAVAQHRARCGIVVDGAGIGSCMAANKVPGVRAAMCYDQATAVNSREHNDANVLTLGAAMIDADLAREIVTTWLSTPAAGGRHARRVAKIMQIEQRYAKRR
jgi:ribose 5-phosphate isomerase B